MEKDDFLAEIRQILNVILSKVLNAVFSDSEK
jgi:hypothetical protein